MKDSVQRVIIHRDSQDLAHGVLIYNNDGPRLILDDGEVIRSKDIGTTFSFSDPPRRISERDRISPIPYLTCSLKYSDESISPDEMYPPSTDGWLEHIGQTGLDATAYVHELTNRDRFLLSIVLDGTMTPTANFTVRPYELGVLNLNTEFQEYATLLQKTLNEADSLYSDFHKTLDGPPPPWIKVAELVEGVNIPNFELGLTMRETLDSLVPRSFPSGVRNELMTFLAWTTQVTFPSEDPVEFFEKLESTRIFRDLACGHLQCILDGIPPPSYVKTMLMAAEGRLTQPKRAKQPVLDDTVQNPWYLTWHQLSELFPNWLDTAIEYSVELNESRKIITTLPVTKAAAKRNRKAWRDRLAVYFQGLMLRGIVKYAGLGLSSLVYIGAAHRWPHNHLSWSAQIGTDRKNPKFIHIMIAPPRAAERITHAIGSSHRIEWSFRRMNLSLYDKKKQTWKMTESRIYKSLSGSRSLRQLENEFGKWNNLHPKVITENEAKTLDIVSWGVYLSTLELGKITNHYKIDGPTLRKTIEDLQRRNLLTIEYHPIPKNLVSLFITAKGSPRKIHSLARAFITHTPSSTVMSSPEKETVVIFSRLPEENVHSVAKSLPIRARDNDVEVSCLPLTSFVGYRHNLFQRLLNDDGTWNEDTNMMLSQIRLPTTDSAGNS